ncbi:MAG TPA: SPFH domain-containing protein [Verrucomicrobiae bacterium]|nr:SPFH domain-containing protein [Verrucomicrobiae bacterium]
MAIGRMVIGVLGAAALGFGMWRCPPVQTLPPGEVGVRINGASGEARQFGEGTVWLVPGLHELRRYSLRDRVYRDAQSLHAEGGSPFQTNEGLSVGVDLTIRYALDADTLETLVRRLPDDLDRVIVEPLLRGTAHRIFTKYTAKEIFSSRRADIQAELEKELAPRLKADGIVLRSVDMGRVDLPAQYRAGLERLLQQEVESEQMKHTLVLKDQQVKQSALEAEADKVRREKNAEASAREQVIAAKAQADSMKYVITYKQKQIEQRKLEAEADKLQRVRQAEATAESRRIEAAGEADSRRRLAEAEIFRAEGLARVSGDQMQREGAALSAHPLLVQKAMADKLSDKISVMVMPPGTDGAIIDAALLGKRGR